MNCFFRITILSFFLCLCYNLPGISQGQKVNFEHLNIEQGLSHNYVTSVIQDRKGFLWFGTTNGLNKYDGYQFTHYTFDPNDTTSLSKNIVLTLWEDSEGIIWIGTNEDICKFDPRTEKFTRLEKSDSNPYAFRFAQSFAEDTEGNIWIAGSFDGQLRRVNRKTGKFSAINYASALGHKLGHESGNTSLFSLITICKDKAGTLWMGSSSGLHRLTLTSQGTGKASKVNFTHYRHNPADPFSISPGGVAGIFEDHKGVLWLITQEGFINAFDHTSGRFTHYLPDPHKPAVIGRILETGITEDLAGNLWIGTLSGLYSLDKERKKITNYMHDPFNPSSLSNNFVTSVLADQSGILWIATLDGINKSDPHLKPFSLYCHDPLNPNSLSHNKVKAICEDKEGIVWVGTLGGGLNALNKTTGEFTHYRHNQKDTGSLGNDLVTAILEDREGNLWIGNGEVLSRFDYKKKKFIHYLLQHPFQKGSANLPIFTMYEDRQGIFWLGTNNGLIKFDPKSGKTISYPYDPNHPEKISDWVVLCIQEDKEGYLWLGHGSMGLDRFNPKTGKVIKYVQDGQKQGSISTNTVVSFYEDFKGNLWIGTDEGGLCQFNYSTETFTTFTVEQGLAGNSVYSILEDNEANLWLGTNNGLSKFSPASKIFTNYDAADGLQSNLFTPLMYEAVAFKEKDGTLYFGGNNGFSAFNPAAVHANTYVPPVVITQFSLFDKPLAGKQEAKEIELAYDENFFSVEFAALNYTNSEKNQYAYQLQGIDKDWVNTGSRRLASYTDIGPGHYTFRVKGSNNDGVWNQKATTLTIIIHPPWWRTPWAYGFYFLCLLTAIFASDRYQRKRLIAKEREKAREKELMQAKEIEKAYHELKRTQTQLIQSEKMASLGELTAGIAHEIQNPLNFVNNFSEVSEELCSELEQEAKNGHTEGVIAISADLKQNLSKIHHHGKRADSIVKGMLQHSRSSSGEKQPTDINALVDEYIRLAYHGLRAKEKDFNADFKLEADPAVGKVNIVPQEIGRVLLNLFNNAFYATQQKKHQLNGFYQPQVLVSTKAFADKVEIRIRDNGTGISENVKSKIFQPFFTTKPTGEGTGLGLSLSYDIITKGHGGELTVQSQEGEFTEFIIHLTKSAKAM
ncbi:histidine kinase [Rhodocytophaga rosea]|uniref:histidine kinase n=1 Tax=Rhodocytophaga rosea TaxID=2704465 RepID=A0A6C0GNY2_9BACT|nr:sensor histidine kinase [Rhodocytophaga rosea]QHT69758.1 histidine kinase [Rhodocytophaga rosea]